MRNAVKKPVSKLVRNSVNKPKAAPKPGSVQGRDEMNLVDFPFATLNHKDSRDAIECTTWHTDSVRGRYQQKWIVSGNSRLGLPHEIADQVLLALILVWGEQERARTFSPTLYRLLKVLDLPPTKHYYDLLKKTLLQLDGLRFRSERAFWDNNRRQHVSLESFGLFDSLRLAFCVDGDFVGEEEAGNLIEWSTPIWKSLQAGYLKTINLSFYLTLRRPLTRRLYRFLDKQLHYRNGFEIDIFSLAGRLGMQDYAYRSKVKEKLQPAVDELIERGFLDSMEYVQVGKYTRACFVKALANPLSDYALPDNALPDNAAPADGAEDGPADGAADGPEDGPDAVTQAYTALWDQVLDGLRPHITSATFYSFVEPTVLLSMEEGRAVVGARHAFAQGWLQSRMVRRFRDELNHHLRVAGLPVVSELNVVPLGNPQQDEE